MIRGFTVEHLLYRLLKHPIEDSYAFDERIGAIAVADGVTRDPMVYLPNIKYPWGQFRFVRHYPKPSGAKKSADLFCETFLRCVREFHSKDEQAVRDCFREANRLIMELNHRENSQPDYLMNDFYACTAAAVVENIHEGSIAYGFISDCGLAVFDSSATLKFRTENEGAERHSEDRWELLRSLGLMNWRHPAGRWIWRKVFRNNPTEPCSFGVLTGEETAMHYVRTGIREKQPGDLLAVYSDGLEPVVFNHKGDVSRAFANTLGQGVRQGNFDSLEVLCKDKVKSEGTLVIKT